MAEKMLTFKQFAEAAGTMLANYVNETGYTADGIRRDPTWDEEARFEMLADALIGHGMRTYNISRAKVSKAIQNEVNKRTNLYVCVSEDIFDYTERG